MKVENMTSASGNKIANQFIVEGATIRLSYKNKSSLIEGVAFQSYDSIIVLKAGRHHDRQIFLDKNTWDYSTTTGKYRNQFLGEDKKTTQNKIDSGEYKLANLN